MKKIIKKIKRELKLWPEILTNTIESWIMGFYALMVLGIFIVLAF